MRIDLTDPDQVKTFVFPDGQPHVQIKRPLDKEVDLYTSIKSPNDLMTVLLAKDVLDRVGIEKVRLHIGYLMGARMDRPIPEKDLALQPFTMKVVADMLNTAHFDAISIFDPHSDVAPALLNARAVLPYRNVSLALSRLPANTAVAIPDAGAIKRTHDILQRLNGINGHIWTTIQCLKHRDPATGKLSGFRVVDDVDGLDCLIVDDICDGGGTFVGLAEKLREAGAKSVHLYVSHGIFSKGWDLKGIDTITTTTSYCDDVHPLHVHVDAWS